MPRPFALPLAVALAIAPAAAAPADPPRASGRIVAGEARVEILGTPVRVGERIDLPEGWYRVEEAGPEDGEVGSFSVVPAEALAGAGGVIADEPADAAAPADGAPVAPDCRAERSAYLAELWRSSGIDVSSPGALLEALESGSGAATGFHWLALATDPFRPLAWSSALRERAEALVRCARAN